MNLKPRLSHDANILATSGGWRLGIPAGPAGRYRLSQIDDHAGISRRAYPWHPPATLSLRARVSAESTPGTWGFGFWNDPFGFSFGPGDVFLRLPALPNATWFFYASPRNYLSFRDDKPAHGFLAQTFRSPRFHPLLMPAALALPFAPKWTRRLLGQVVHEDSAALRVDVTRWHTYRLCWTAAGCTFQVDEDPVLRSPLSPRPPLGLVLWIDNQYAAFTPQGRLAWGLEQNPLEAWLELEDIELK
jgi:hypothetical protein